MKKTILMSLFTCLAASQSIFALDCNDFQGTWTGTCTRENIFPNTANITATINFSNSCQNLTVTGVPFVFADGLIVHKSLTTISRTSFLSSTSVQSTYVNSVQENVAEDRYFFTTTVDGMNTNSLVPTNSTRTLSRITSHMFIRNNGQLRIRSRNQSQLWINGVALPSAQAGIQVCDLTLQP